MQLVQCLASCNCWYIVGGNVILLIRLTVESKANFSLGVGNETSCIVPKEINVFGILGVILSTFSIGEAGDATTLFATVTFGFGILVGSCHHMGLLLDLFALMMGLFICAKEEMERGLTRVK